MITLTREEAQQVLDALNSKPEWVSLPTATIKAIETLRARLAEKEQEQVALPIPFRAQGQQIASDGDDKAFCDLYSKEQMLAYGKASELAIDKTMVKRIATQLGWKPPLDVEQEPVAWMEFTPAGDWFLAYSFNPRAKTKPLYTAPPQREWVGLTDEEMNAVYRQAFGLVDSRLVGDQIKFVSAIEAKLKEKNHE